MSDFGGGTAEDDEGTTNCNNNNICDLVRRSCGRYCDRREQFGDDADEHAISAEAIAAAATPQVRICKDAVPALATEILLRRRASEAGGGGDAQKEQQERAQAAAKVSTTTSTSSLVEWDEEGWHYRPDAGVFAVAAVGGVDGDGDGESSSAAEAVRRERIAAYVLALDAVNFCFWPPSSTTTSIDGEGVGDDQDDDESYSYEYSDLATCLTSIASSDHDRFREADAQPYSSERFALSAAILSRIGADEMTTLFRNHHPRGRTPPMMQDRRRMWNEIGAVLLDKFQGKAWNLIRSCAGGSGGDDDDDDVFSGPALVQVLYDNFEGFRDVVAVKDIVDGKSVGSDKNNNSSNDEDELLYFMKRAQICVGDWNAALDLKLRDMDKLTMFPDYRVPQLLRHRGILRYSDQLASKIDALQELPRNGVEECSIRAASVTAVEMLVDELRKRQLSEQQRETDDGDRLTAIAVDWYLWQVGEKNKGELQPHHRVRTIYY